MPRCGHDGARIAREWSAVWRLDWDGKLSQKHAYEINDGTGHYKTDRRITDESVERAIAQERESPMKTPMIHHNGTFARDLLEGYIEAASALRVAIRAVAERGSNARDHYVQESGAFEVAWAEHEDRLKRLNAAREELEQLAENVAVRL